MIVVLCNTPSAEIINTAVKPSLKLTSITNFLFSDPVIPITFKEPFIILQNVSSDETFWRIMNGSLNVIGITGSENRKLVIDVNFKDGFTAVFIISADGVLHKTTIILKGKTINLYNKTQLSDDTLFH